MPRKSRAALKEHVHVYIGAGREMPGLGITPIERGVRYHCFSLDDHILERALHSPDISRKKREGAYHWEYRDGTDTGLPDRSAHEIHLNNVLNSRPEGFSASSLFEGGLETQSERSLALSAVLLGAAEPVDHAGLLAECKRILHPRGRLVVAATNTPGQFDASKLKQRAAEAGLSVRFVVAPREGRYPESEEKLFVKRLGRGCLPIESKSYLAVLTHAKGAKRGKR